MKFAQILCLLTVSYLLTACAWLTKPSQAGPSPLVIASCPSLTPLGDNTFGATMAKLVEVSGIYYQCRAAAGIVAK